jgi:hypothetical protein
MWKFIGFWVKNFIDMSRNFESLRSYDGLKEVHSKKRADQMIILIEKWISYMEMLFY